MKKIKQLFLLSAVTVSVTAAIASQSQLQHFQQTQYFKMNTPWGYYYYPAGRSGIDYYCGYAPYAVCTYYQPEGYDQFIPGQDGYFVPICNW